MKAQEGLNSRRENVHWACNILMENAKLCGERRQRPHVNGCYSSISLYFIDSLNNWAFVVVRYDPVICCVLHARVHPAERHKPTPPLPPPSPWLLARSSSKGLALVYLIQILAYTTQGTGTSPSTEPSRHTAIAIRSPNRASCRVTFHLVYTNSSPVNTAGSNIKTRNDTSDGKSSAFYWQTFIIKSF